jgi:hypothetical protein
MIQKYFIERHQSSGDFTIEERAVIDPIPRGSSVQQLNENNYSLIYKKTYACNKIEMAVQNGKFDLKDTIRNSYFFPVEEHCEAIGDSIRHILKSGEAQAELFFDSCQVPEDEEAAEEAK